MSTSGDKLRALIDRLSEQDQERLLSYAQALAHRRPFPHTPLPPGSPPDALLRLSVSPEIGEALQHALDDCEHIYPDEWE
jgi:hypothetical protein